jgi:glycosyltransferase involved in cell wall biosynthesis
MLAWEYPPHIVGGMGKHVAELVPALAALGVEVTVVTPLLGDATIHEQPAAGARVVRVEPPPMLDYDYPTFVAQTNRALEQAALLLAEEGQGFDLIHTHDWLTTNAGVALKHQWRIPLIATIHATERGRGRGVLAGWQARRIDQLEWSLSYEAWRVIVCSHFMARQLGDYFATPADKISVVPNGVNIHPNPFANARERMAFRRRFASDNQPLGIYVGRIVYEKGLHVLLDAWPQVNAQTNARLVIAGAGGYLEELKSQAVGLGITNQVIFTGFIPDEDRDGLYHVADVACFPSLYEPFGIVALEAFAAKCPVVVADTGGLAEVVRLHETGLLVYPNSVDSLAWGILHTLQHPEWSRQRATNAFREVGKNYTWQRVARETRNVYNYVYADWCKSDWGVAAANLQPSL